MTGTAIAISAAGCGSHAGAEHEAPAPVVTVHAERRGDETTSASSGTPDSFASRPLLELAFDAAAAIPIDPHVKDRSRAQQAVIEACLSLDQPMMAAAWIGDIQDWRRGAAAAELANVHVRAGNREEALRWLDLASRTADSLDGWQRERILGKVAAARVWLSGADGSVDPFNAQVEAIDRALATAAFEDVKGALETCAMLYGRLYHDADRRSLMDERIRLSWEPMPVPVRLDLLMTMAEAALSHGDQPTGLRLVNEANAMFEYSRWTPEYGIPLRAKLAGLRHRAGDAGPARESLDAAEAEFEAAKSTIINIDWADVIRAIAEARLAMGDEANARTAYRNAIESGAVNPNARPRAEDLCLTCCSMATRGLEPDQDMWTRLRELRAGLGRPW